MPKRHHPERPLGSGGRPERRLNSSRPCAKRGFQPEVWHVSSCKLCGSASFPCHSFKSSAPGISCRQGPTTKLPRLCGHFLPSRLSHEDVLRQHRTLRSSGQDFEGWPRPGIHAASAAIVLLHLKRVTLSALNTRCTFRIGMVAIACGWAHKGGSMLFGEHEMLLFRAFNTDASLVSGCSVGSSVSAQSRVQSSSARHNKAHDSPLHA